jgi:hypothetical protein
MTNVLTDELLARAERVYRMALARGAGGADGYDGRSGVSAGLEQEPHAEEKKWPI